MILLSLLMAAGLEGAAVIATDAVISLATSVDQDFGVRPGRRRHRAGAGLCVLIGGIAIPGAFLAKAFVERMPVHIHTAILDAAVITGGVVMITRRYGRSGDCRRRRYQRSRGGSSSVSERMMRSGFTVEPAGRPSPCTSIQMA